MILAADLAFRNIGCVVMNKSAPITWGTIKIAPLKKKHGRVSDAFAEECTQFAVRLDKLISAYPFRGIVAELPGGSQNARAAKLLGAAVCGFTSIATLKGLPLEWISERDSKMGTLNTAKANKATVMAWATKAYPNCDFSKLPASKFEHIADAFMAYNSLKDGLLIKTFG